MIIIKRFSTNQLLRTTGVPGFGKRRLQQDLTQLGKMDSAQRELHNTLSLNNEIRKMNKELNNGRLGKWQDID